MSEPTKADLEDLAKALLCGEPCRASWFAAAAAQARAYQQPQLAERFATVAALLQQAENLSAPLEPYAEALHWHRDNGGDAVAFAEIFERLEITLARSRNEPRE